MTDAPEPVSPPGTELEPSAESRPAAPRPSTFSMPMMYVLLGGALLIVIGGTLVARSGIGRHDPSDAAKTAPVSVSIDTLAIEPLQVQVSADNVWGTRSHQAAFTRAFGAAIKPYLARDYPAAIERMQDVASLFPKAPEPLVYGGVSELLAGHPDKAIDLLTQAAPLAGELLAEDITWYLALAHRAIGESGLSELRTVCAVGGEHGPRACAAMREIEARERAATESASR